MAERNEDDPKKMRYEEAFMLQVRNIGAQRQQKPERGLIEEISNFADHRIVTASLTSESVNILLY